MTNSARITVAAVPLMVEYVVVSETHVEIVGVWPEGGLDDIKALLAPDVTNSISVACIKHARSEADFLRRIEEQERLDP